MTDFWGDYDSDDDNDNDDYEGDFDYGDDNDNYPETVDDYKHSQMTSYSVVGGTGGGLDIARRYQDPIMLAREVISAIIYGYNDVAEHIRREATEFVLNPNNISNLRLIMLNPTAL